MPRQRDQIMRSLLCQKSIKFSPKKRIQFATLGPDGAEACCNKRHVLYFEGNNYTWVNFTNNLRADFVLISFCHKITNPNCKHRKAVQNTFVQKAASKMLVKLTQGFVFNFSFRFLKRPFVGSLLRWSWSQSYKRNFVLDFLIVQYFVLGESTCIWSKMMECTIEEAVLVFLGPTFI